MAGALPSWRGLMLMQPAAEQPEPLSQVLGRAMRRLRRAIVYAQGFIRYYCWGKWMARREIRIWEAVAKRRALRRRLR